MSIGINIKSYRKSRNMTQEQLALVSNISRTYLADVERDRYNPSIETLRDIAKALGVSTNALLSDEQSDLDPEVRAIARDIDELSPSNRDLLKAMIKTMREQGREALNK